MNIYLDIKKHKNPYTVDYIDDDFDEFQSALEEMHGFIDGVIYLNFDPEKIITLDLFVDFSVCYDELLMSIKSAEKKTFQSDTIWFCEQGSDFYIDYSVKGDCMLVAFKKGKEVGNPNATVNEFSIVLQTAVYVQQWKKLFNELEKLFFTVLGKKILSPLNNAKITRRR